ncbi:MAG: hypothetical protein AAF226_18435, partial [Verrucomicrobiota bacterium]
ILESLDQSMKPMPERTRRWSKRTWRPAMAGVRTPPRTWSLPGGKVKASTQDPDALVFSSPKGKGIDIHNFSCRAWTKILAALDLPHRKFYQTRHTFITLCLDAGIDAKDIAKWVGNSPEMIDLHYACRNPNLVVPVL